MRIVENKRVQDKHSYYLHVCEYYLKTFFIVLLIQGAEKLDVTSSLKLWLVCIFFWLANVYKFLPGDNENSCETSDFSVIYRVVTWYIRDPLIPIFLPLFWSLSPIFPKFWSLSPDKKIDPIHVLHKILT